MVVVSVVVLGDIGRSPRMQYHVVSLTSEGYDVDIIGYDDSKPIKKVAENGKVSITSMTECPRVQKYLPRVIGYALKALWQSVVLFFCLLFKRKSDIVLVQSPPAIPTLLVTWLYCKVADARFIIDWHNYAYTNMAFTLGDRHPLVGISEWVESCFGKKADSSLCVTKAMKNDLQQKWGIEANVLYDKPFESFSATPLDEQHRLFTRLGKQYNVFANEFNVKDYTAFTKCLPNGEVVLLEDRPAFLISSTSWTEDEDFNILLSALVEYDQSEDKKLPPMVCVITGKGPMKEYYNRIIEDTKWNKVKIVTPWLEAEDYPLLLGSADLGVSLHLSTSGLDLPMKVVDMFGCGLPVAAHTFPALSELVVDGKTGMVFETSSQLATQLQDWFRDFPNNQERRTEFRKNIESTFLNLRWHENWVLHASPVFKINDE